MEIGLLLRSARLRNRVTQHGLAARANTSQATIAAYESGRKVPRFDTLARLAHALDLRLAIQLVPTTPDEHEERDPSALRREEIRSLWLHRAIAARIQLDPSRARALARTNLATVRAADSNGHSEVWTRRWSEFVDGPVDVLLGVLTSTSLDASQLRQTAPFAGLLTPRERWAVYRSLEAAGEARTA